MDAAKPREVADAIAEAVRTLNYLTGVGSGPVALEYPADLYDVIAGLKIAADRLPQLFCQTSLWLEQQAASGLVAHDTGANPSGYIADLAQALMLATCAAAELSEHLGSAHSACSGLKAGSSPD